jgi:micrococcal nuclease
MVTIKVFIMSLADFVLSQPPILSVALSVAHSQVRFFRGDGSRACNAAYSGCSGNRVFQFSSLPAYADLTGQVIHVADGDTLTLVINKEWVRARLAGIDAPEANQPFGKLSRESLSDLCFWQQVTVIPKGKDQYGRMFAQVFCGDVDAGAEQVRRGMAWVYDHDVKDNDLQPLQADAKTAKRGLWADPYSKPPWKWREVWQE